MLGRSGKRIDPDRAQKATSVSAHIINENSQEPNSFEKSIYDRNTMIKERSNVSYGPKSTNIKLAPSQRSQAELPWAQN